MRVRQIVIRTKCVYLMLRQFWSISLILDLFIREVTENTIPVKYYV